MIKSIKMSLNTYIFILIEFFMNVYETSKHFAIHQQYKLKSYVFNGYFIRYDCYDKHKKEYYKFYNYDSFLGTLIYIFLKFILRRSIFILPIETYSNSNSIIQIGTYYHENKKHYLLGNLCNKPKSNIIYCTLDNKYDLTHELNHLKNDIFLYELTAKDLLYILSYFFKKNYPISNDSEIKMMFDDTFNELIYKGNQILFI